MSALSNLGERICRLWRRHAEARRLGIAFTRAATFKIPDAILLNGSWIYLDVPDEHSQRVAFVELLLDDCYGLRALARRATINTIIDVGANVGLFGIAARACFPDARIHCYEPNPMVTTLLARHASEARCEHFPVAISRNGGPVALETSAEGSVFTRTRHDADGGLESISLRAALDRMGGSADLVKMDCEGAEWELLEDHSTWRRIAHLTMEYHLGPDHTHDSIGSAMAKLGFRALWRHRASNFGLLFAERIAP